jgi:parallel beta-helix repeat protein
MQRNIVAVILVVLLALPSACNTPSAEVKLLFPETRPDLPVPPEFELTLFTKTFNDTVYNVTGDIRGYLFQDCEVHISGTGLTISESMFVNTQVFVGESRELTFEKSIFERLNRYEKTVLNINESDNISITDCIFRHNFIGLGIHSSSASVASTRFEYNNGHNAIVIGEGSSAFVSGNYFYGNFPHAMLIMNREGSPDAWVDITNNVIEKTGEDAIDFEDYRNALPSFVTGNVIVDTGWSAVIVEYNSWNADVTIEDNWIENTGIDWSLSVHDLQPDAFQPGWGHGIFIEDSDNVVITRNRIVAAGENGIEIRNGRDIRVENNGIDCARVAVSAHRYHESSLDRPFSPLWPDEAGGSSVTAVNNTIYGSSSEYEADESSEIFTQ